MLATTVTQITHNVFYIIWHNVLFIQLSQASLNGLPNGIDFSVTSSPARRRRQDTPESAVSPSANINVPNSLLSGALEGRDDIGVVFAYYSNSSLFPLVSNESEIATSVIAARFTNQSAETNLSENVSVNFQLLEPVILY